MLQAGVEDFFDPVEFGAPKIAHVVEAFVDRVETPVDHFETPVDILETIVPAVEFCIDISDEEAHHRGVEQRRHPDRQIELLVSHEDNILLHPRRATIPFDGPCPQGRRNSANMSIRENVEKLIELVERGEFLEAIEKYYAPDATMQENLQLPVRTGLLALLENERLALTTRFKILHQSRAASFVVDGNRAAINWIFEVTEHSGKHWLLDEIAYQEWQEGKIVRERFYYDPGLRQIETGKV
jgi:hypothetical protein